MRNFTFPQFNLFKLFFIFSLFFSTTQTRAQFPYSQSFKNSTAPGVLFGGSPVAFLTGGAGAKDGYTDANGSGYLRLTNNQGNQKGIVYSDVYSFPSAYGMTITFEYYTHSTTSGTGADGIAFILFDATASPVTVGAFGGSLGYAQRNTETGFSKGYLGIGIDEYGNFSAANEGKTGGVGVLSSNVTLRGAGTGTTGYRHLISSQTTALASPFNVAGNSRTDTDNTKAGFRKMEVVLKPRSGGGFIINVYLTHGTVRDRIISDYIYTDMAPSNLKFAISSSTGGSNNFHELRNLNITVDESTLLTPVANPDEFIACAGSTAVSGDITANDNGAVNTMGSINKSTVDLDPATAGIQTSYTVPNKGTLTYDSSTGKVTFVPLNNTVVGPVEINYTFNDNYNKTSNSAKLTYKTYDLILNNTITAPSPSTFCTVSADPAIISGSAATVNGGTITYQWESSLDNVTFSPMSITTASYDPPSANTTMYYRRIASSANCKNTSNVAAIIFGGASTPTATTATAITCNSFTANWNSVANATSYGIIVSKNADFSNPELPYDGRNLNSSNNSINIPGLTSGQTYYYKVWSYNSCGVGTTASNVITVVIGSGSVAGTVSFAQTICSGSSPSDLTLSGYTGSIQWQSSTNNTAFSNISGVTGATLTSTQMGSLSVNTYYRAVVKSGTCTEANTASVLITVSPSPTLTSASQLTSPVCEGSTARISLTGLLNNSTSTISYSIDGVAQTPVAGIVATGTTANFETVVLTGANNNKILKITGITTTSTIPNCSSVVDKDVTLKVNVASVGGTIATAQNICAGTSPADLVLSGQTGNVTKWQKATNAAFTGATDITVASTTLTGASIGNLNANTYFRAIVQNGVCSAAFSSPITITVTTPPNAGTLSGIQDICIAGSTTFSSNGKSGGSWSTSDSNIATVNSSGVIIGVAAGTATITYTVTGTGGCSNATATRKVTVTTPPNAGTLSGQQALCVSSTTIFTSDGNTGGSWSSNNTNVATVDAFGFITGVAAGNATITYKITGTGGCSDATAIRTVTVNALPTASITGTLNACLTTTLTAVTNAGSPTFIWYKNDVVISGQTSSKLVVTEDGSYKVKIKNSSTTCEQTSAASTVKVSDTQKPTITCPANVTTKTDANSCTATGVVLGNPVTADNCEVKTVTNNAPTTFPIGNTTVIWTVTDTSGNTETCNQTVKVVGPIKAENDLTSSFNGLVGGLAIANVLDNDFLNCNKVTLSDVNLSLLGTLPSVLTFDISTGAVSVNTNTPTGTYSFDYKICEKANTNNCSVATATVEVVNGLVANIDSYSNQTSGTTAVNVGNVTSNDKLNGTAVTSANTAVTPKTEGPLSVDADGKLILEANTASGTYTLTYNICESGANPSNCKTATATVEVVNGLVANTDTYTNQTSGTATLNVGNVTSNDKLNGTAVTSANTAVTPKTEGPLSVDADGKLTLEANTASGTYTLTYNICESGANPSNCKTATATVEVVNGLVANIDSYTNQTSGTTALNVGNVTSNDKLNGTAVTSANTAVTPKTEGPLSVDADGELTLEANTASGTYTLTYNICESGANPSNCKTATATVEVKNEIKALIDTISPINGSIGGTTTISLIDNDTLNGKNAVIGANPGNVTIAIIGTLPTGLTLNADGTITVAPNTPAANYNVQYTICEVGSNPSNCDTVTSIVPVTAANLVANADAVQPVTGSNKAQDLGVNVLDNDTKDGQKLNPSDVKLTVEKADPKGYLVLNADGTLTLGANAPAGKYELTYTICEKLNSGNCSSNTVSVTVTAPVIDAIADTITPINGNIGDNTISLVANDTLNGSPVVIGTNAGEVTFTLVGTLPTGLTLNADYSVTVAPNTAAGNYEVKYTICDNNNSGNCDTVTSIVPVTAANLVANADAVQPVTGSNKAQDLGVNVLDNDTKDGQKLNPSDVKLTVEKADPKGYLVLNADGTLTLGANAPAGNYELTYSICEKLNSGNCSSNTVSVTVTAPVIDAIADTITPINGNIGDNTISLVANDTLNGSPVVIGTNAGEVTFTLVGTLPTGLTLNADYTITVAPNTPAANYEVKYTICDNNNSGNCDTVTSIVPVTAANLVANADEVPPVTGSNKAQDLGVNVLDNDTKNGQKLNPSDVKLTVEKADPKGYLVLNADGTLTLGANAPAGKYELTYSICEKLNSGNCSSNTVSVTVTAPVIDAIADTISPINGNIGDHTISLVANDTLNGSPVVIGTNAGEVTFILVGTLPTGLTLNADYSVTVAPNTAAGNYEVKYTICDNNNSGNCDTVTSIVPVTAANLVANADAVPPVTGSNKAQDLGVNVLDNDTKDGQKLNPSDVKLTVEKADPKGYLVLNADGTLTLGANAPAGKYELTYSICEKLNSGNCSSNTVSVTVIAPVASQIIANNDEAGPVDSKKGLDASLNIFANDILNGVKPNPSDVILKTVVANPNLVLNSDGSVNIVANTPSGIYQLTYQICEAANTSNCSQAVVKITVQNSADPVTPNAGQLNLVNDTNISVDGINGSLEFVNVLDNDLIDGQPINPANVTIKPLTTNAYFEWNADGTVNVKPNTPGATYTLNYQVCEKANPTNCSTAVLTVFVEVPSISVIKTAVFNDENKSGFANAGETISYRFTVTNTGNVPLIGITLNDPLPGVIVSGQAINLAVNESNDTNFTAVYKITQQDINRGSVSNQASVKGRSARGVEVEDQSDDVSNSGDSPTVLDLSGCSIQVMNAFSPNGDDKNARFYIRGIECYPDNTVEIYNRWGVLVFAIDQYNNSDRVFVGYSNGRSTIKQTEGLPVGTYFYILKYKDSANHPNEKSGYLYINK